MMNTTINHQPSTINHQPSTINHQPSTIINILCIGDSITQGGRLEGEYTYRYPLYQKLKLSGLKINFVGSQQKGRHESFIWPKDFDFDHEGYYNKKTAFVTKSVIANLNKFESPNIVIIHLGTNDKIVSEATISNPLKQIVHALRAKNPKTKILLVQIPGWRNVRIHFLVRKTALALNEDMSPVKTVPLYAFWDTKKHTFDGAHPNQLGQEVIANVLHDYVISN